MKVDTDFDNEIIETLIIYEKAKTFIGLLIKENKYTSKRFKRFNKAIS